MHKLINDHFDEFKIEKIKEKDNIINKAYNDIEETIQVIKSKNQIKKEKIDDDTEQFIYDTKNQTLYNIKTIIYGDGDIQKIIADGDKLKNEIDEKEKTKIQKLEETYEKFRQEICAKIEAKINAKSDEINKLLNKYSMNNGLVNGNLIIKCKNGDVRTHSYILKYLHKDYESLPLDFMKQPNEQDEKVIIESFVKFKKNVIINLLRMLCEGTIWYPITWDFLVNSFLIFDQLPVSDYMNSIFDQTYNAYMKNGLQKCGHWLDGLNIVMKYNNKYLVKIANEIIKENFEAIKGLGDSHKYKVCSCYLKKEKCVFVSFPDNYRIIINNKMKIWDAGKKFCCTDMSCKGKLMFCRYNGMYYCRKHFDELSEEDD